MNLYKNLIPFLNCKDYTVSKEEYQVQKNEDLELLVTTPVPTNLADYYKSENYISHTDSKKTLFDKCYQVVKNYALKKKLALINSFETSEKTILDVGAGTGDFLKTCKNNKWKTFGVEPSAKARSIAKNKGIFLEESIEAYQNKKFEVITLWHVLEHVEDLPTYISTLKNALKENGILLIAVPNYNSFDAEFYKEFWAAYDVPRHFWHFSQKSISKIFASVSMEVKKTLPMKLDAFYVSLLSEKYKTGKMKPFNSFWIGFLSNWKARTTSEYSSLIYVLKNK